MARQIGKLSALVVGRAKDKGLYGDGGGLYLQVTTTGSKSWLFRYMLKGRAREMGLGAAHAISLADARSRAAECRKLLASGIDPLGAKRTHEAKARLDAARSITFEQCASKYIESHKAGWRNAKHAQQWTNTLNTYAHPILGKLSVADIDVALVMKVLEPIWQSKVETASRLRGRIESILDWATSREYRQGDNPARWKGKLENLLPRPSKIQKTKHYAALPHEDVNGFLKALSNQEGLAAKALELVIFTATRSGEALQAKWDEFDLKKKIWVIPAERMKAGQEHRVPLSDSALAVLKPLHENRNSDFVFPGMKKDKPLSNMAMLVLLRRMGRDDITVHGFRSSFRMWAAEQTSFPREIAELCLAHTIGTSVERAYQRSDLFEKRRQLMSMWAKYCAQEKVEGRTLVSLVKRRKGAI